MGDEADLQLLTMVDLYIYRYIIGTHDSRLRAKFFKESVNLPLLKSLKRFTYHAYEVAQEVLKSLHRERAEK